jgi:RNA polymerase sigma-70 factor (ECF subfamily)
MDSATVQQMQNTPYNEAADDDLVCLCQAGDQHAFAELVRRHRPPVLKVAFSIMRDRQDAEDEVQNALWKAYEHIQQFHREAKFSTWLTRIVVNQCLMRLRRVKRASFLYLDEALSNDETLTMQLPDTRPSPEQELGDEQVCVALRTEISRTPPLLRNVFLLRDVEEMPMPEVAEKLGISVAAAKSRLLRARAELRSRMQRHCGDTGPATLLA